jgi:katanin p80 WD40 repeat-containing subunit B1
MSTSKVLHNFLLHDAPISCIKFNPMDMAMASGGADKTVKYWDLEHFSLVIFFSYKNKDI